MKSDSLGVDPDGAYRKAVDGALSLRTVKYRRQSF
jgi:hypothetical protein